MKLYLKVPILCKKISCKIIPCLLGFAFHLRFLVPKENLCNILPINSKCYISGPETAAKLHLYVAQATMRPGSSFAQVK